MNSSNLLLRSWIVVVAIVTLALILVGCGKKEGEAAKPQAEQAAQPGQPATATIVNLKADYALEMKRVDWYERFSKQAQKESLGDVAVLFRALARSEKVHAEKIAALLNTKGIEASAPATIEAAPAGKARQYLKLSLSNENVEEASMTAFQAQAKNEQFAEAEELFRRLSGADARQGRLLKKAIEQETNFARLPYVMCPECGYIVGSDKIDECPVCKTKKDKFQKI
jgi:rubrerythrin